MTVTKLAISLPPDLAESCRASANELGVSVSRYMREALEDRLALDKMRRLVQLVEAESGPLTDDEIAAAERRIYGDA